MRKLNAKKVSNSPFRLEIEERIAELEERNNEENVVTELLILRNLKFCRMPHHDSQNIDIDLVLLTKESIQSFLLSHQDDQNSEEFYSRNVNWVVRQRILELI